MSLKPCGILLRARVFLAWDRVSGYEIHDSAPSLHSWASYKIIAELSGATQILYKPHAYEHGADLKNPISEFGIMAYGHLLLEVSLS
jgi:hypothetical protein